MRKLFTFIVLLACGIAHAQAPWQIQLRGRNATNSAFLDYFPAVPSSGVYVLGFDGVTHTPMWLAPGTGISTSTSDIQASGVAPTWNTLTLKPAWTGVFDGSYPSLSGLPVLFDGTWSSLSGKPATFPPSAHTHPSTEISDSTATGRAVLTAASQAAARTAINAVAPATTLSGYGISDAYPLTGNPSSFLTSINGGLVTTALGFTPYNATNPSSFINLAQSRAGLSVTNTGTGATTFNPSTGVLNAPLPVAQTQFNFTDPATRTLAVSTSYQAADPTKAAFVTISPACTNATQLLVSSACTLQVRQHTSAVTCSTGTVSMTWTSTVALGLVFTQTSGSPFDIKVPIGRYFIICPTAGTFTISATEQAAS